MSRSCETIAESSRLSSVVARSARVGAPRARDRAPRCVVRVVRVDDPIDVAHAPSRVGVCERRNRRARDADPAATAREDALNPILNPSRTRGLWDARRMRGGAKGAATEVRDDENGPAVADARRCERRCGCGRRTR